MCARVSPPSCKHPLAPRNREGGACFSAPTLTQGRELTAFALVHTFVRLIAEANEVPLAVSELREVFRWPDVMHSRGLDMFPVAPGLLAQIAIAPQYSFPQPDPASVAAAVVKACSARHGLATSSRAKQKARASKQHAHFACNSLALALKALALTNVDQMFSFTDPAENNQVCC